MYGYAAHRATTLKDTGRQAEAEKSYRLAVAVLEKRFADFRNVVEYRLNLVGCLYNLGVSVETPVRPQDAEQTLRRVIALQEALVADFPAVPQYRFELAESYRMLWNVLKNMKRWADLDPVHRRALALLEKLVEEDPENPRYQSKLGEAQAVVATHLANCPDPALRDPAKAVELVEKAVARAPLDAFLRNTQGVVYYRAGKWAESIAALEKSMELGKDPNWGGASSDWLFLAMAHWQLGHREQALTWHARAVEWMEKHPAHQSNNDELRRYRAEADELLGTGAGPKDDLPPPRND
jgi:tetratricopeptide (TPR) repeat protein